MDLPTVSSFRVVRDRSSLTLAPGETYVAGGTWVFSEPQPAVTGLVDLTELGWPDVEQLDDGGVRIGATCTVGRLRAHAWPAPVARVVAECVDSLLMSFKVQNAATVGGNLCLAFPAGAIIALAAALDGEVVVWTPGGAERREPVVSFVRGPAVTSLQPGEVVRAVDVAGHALNARFALRRIALTTYGRTSALVVARRDDDAVSLTVSGSTPRPLRLTLSRDAPVAEVRAAVAGIEEWYDDQHGAPDWRAAMTERLAVEAVEELR